MEPASMLAKVALGAVALVPTVPVVKKPIQIHVHLGQWNNQMGTPVCIEQVARINDMPNDRLIPNNKQPNLTLLPGITCVNQEVELAQITPDFISTDNIYLSTHIRCTCEENSDFELRLVLSSFVSQEQGNEFFINLRRHIHTRQVNASFSIFDKMYEWSSSDPLSSIHFILSGSLTREDMTDSKIEVKEIRYDKVASLVDLTLPIIERMIREKKIVSNAIPQDLHEKLELLRFIKPQAPANQP